MSSRVPPSIAVCGRRTKEDRWMAERSTLGFGSYPARDSGFRSTCIASATPPRLSGRSAIQKTCAEQRTSSAIRHLEQRKSTTSWRSRVSRVAPSSEPLGMLVNNSLARPALGGHVLRQAPGQAAGGHPPLSARLDEPSHLRRSTAAAASYPFLADAGSRPRNCSGMEEATGAPSSFAV